MLDQTTKWPSDIPSETKMNSMLDRAKGRLFFRKESGFLGSLLCNHTFIWDLTCDTAWCNGSTIGISPEFFFKCSPEVRVSLLVHEIWHTGYDHIGRVGKRDGSIWNQAADYIINNAMDTDGFVMDFPDIQICLDHQYDGMTTEQVYDLLMSMPAADRPDPGDYAMGDDVKPSDDVSDIEVMSKIVQAQQAAIQAKQAGSLPGELELLINKFLNPPLPWDSILNRYFTDLSNDDYSWRRPSRRHTDIYLPSLIGENGLEHLIYFIDISGSISNEEIAYFNSQVYYIHTQITPKRLTLVTFDTKIQNVYEFEQDEPFEEIKVVGRGGTSLEPVFEYIKEHKPTASVIFSDLYCCQITEDPGTPVIWTIINNPNAVTHFGTEIHIPADALTEV